MLLKVFEDSFAWYFKQLEQLVKEINVKKQLLFSKKALLLRIYFGIWHTI